MPGGRPSTRTQAVVDEIMKRLAHGEPLARICDDAHMPDFATVWRWEQADEEFRNLSTRARDVGTHFIADDCLRIADDASIDPADKRIRVDTRLRLIGKWNRRIYGERQQVEHSGSVDIGGKLDEARARVLAASRAAREDSTPE